MSFLNRFFKKKTTIGKVVYGLDSQEVGEISDILTKDDVIEVYEVTTKSSKMKLRFPFSQFFIDDTSRIILLPEWCYHVRMSCSRLVELEKRYTELIYIRSTLGQESYQEHLISILKNSLPCGDAILLYLPKFEELLVDLAKEKKLITEKTTSLMTQRLLEYGIKGDKQGSIRLDRKQYSLKIIDLRNKYANTSKLIYFVSELYDITKASSKFFEKLQKDFGIAKEECEKTDEAIEKLAKRAEHMRNKEVEVLGILDPLMESLLTNKAD